MQTIKHKAIYFAALILTIGSIQLSLAAPALAETDSESAAGSAVECSILPDFICNASQNGAVEESAIWMILIWVINIMTVGIGVLAVGAIVFAGFLYTTARDDAGQVKKSIEIIRNTAIGLIAYAFMYAALNFLIPGGIFAAGPQPDRLAHHANSQEGFYDYSAV